MRSKFCDFTCVSVVCEMLLFYWGFSYDDITSDRLGQLNCFAVIFEGVTLYSFVFDIYYSLCVLI